MTFECFTWIFTGLAMYGSWLNAKRKVSGFYFWIVSNCGWFTINIMEGIWAGAVLFAFFNVMCIYGIRRWRKEDEKLL